jgi:hypothetical protein
MSPTPLDWLRYYIAGQAPEPTAESVQDASQIDSIAPLDQNRGDMLKWFGTRTESITDPYKPMDSVLGDFANQESDAVQKGYPKVFNLLLGNTLKGLSDAANAPYTEEQAQLDALAEGLGPVGMSADTVGHVAGRGLSHLADIKDVGFLGALGTLVHGFDLDRGRRGLLGTGDDILEAFKRGLQVVGVPTDKRVVRNAETMLESLLDRNPDTALYVRAPAIDPTEGDKFIKGIPYSPLPGHLDRSAMERYPNGDYYNTGGYYGPNANERINDYLLRNSDMFSSSELDEARRMVPKNSLLTIHSDLSDLSSGEKAHPLVFIDRVLHEGTHAQELDPVVEAARPIDFYDYQATMEKLRTALAAQRQVETNPDVNFWLDYADKPLELVSTLAGKVFSLPSWHGKFDSYKPFLEEYFKNVLKVPLEPPL